MDDAPIRHFLVVFDAATGAEPQVEVFDDGHVAVEAYARAESVARGRDSLRVVLISADSIETIRKTHSNFWKRERFEDLAAALPPR